MAWIYLIAAGLSEIVWAITIKESHGFTQPLPSIITIIFLVISFYLFSKTLRDMPVGTAYAIFTGIGAVGAVFAGIWLYHESLSFGKLFFLTILIIGMVGLKLSDKKEGTE